MEIEKEERDRARGEREREVNRLIREKKDGEEHFEKQSSLLKQRIQQLETSNEEATIARDEATKALER